MADPVEQRRFTLLDAMVLVVATAGGFAAVRTFTAAIRRVQGPGRPGLADWVALSTWVVSFWMLALLALRLGRPRPPLRRLGRQPGVAACIAGWLALSFQLLYMLPTLRGSRYGLPGLYYIMMSADAISASGAVAAAWATLVLSGRWRAAADWIDRSGRALGIFTIATALLLTVLRLLES
jgi:hypothetical protein